MVHCIVLSKEMFIKIPYFKDHKAYPVPYACHFVTKVPAHMKSIGHISHFIYSHIHKVIIHTYMSAVVINIK